MSETADVGDNRAEYVGEILARQVVVAVDAYPGDVPGTGPPVVNRAGPAALGVHVPQPPDVVRAVPAEKRHNVPPRRYEIRRAGVGVPPGVRVAVQLVTEADHHRLAEGSGPTGARDRVGAQGVLGATA